MNKILGIIIALSFPGCCQSENMIQLQTSKPTDGIRIVWDQGTIQQLAPQAGRSLAYAGYPRLRRLRSGTLMVVYEAEGNAELIQSGDNGKTWSAPTVIMNHVNYTNPKGESTVINISNPELIQLQNGDLVFACNYRPAKEGIAPYSIVIKRSKDLGKTWLKEQKLYDAQPRFKDGCWEPAMLQLPDGELQVYFSNEAPYIYSDEQEICLLSSRDNGETWDKNPKTVSFRAGRRDGMPVPLLVDDEIIVSIEDNKTEQFKPYIVRKKLADNWSVPVLANSSNREYALKDEINNSIYAGAPYMIRIPSGEVILSYQTTKNRTSDWEKSTMEVAIGDRTGRYFDRITQPFDVPLEREAKWNSLAVLDEHTIVALSSTNFRTNSVGVSMILGHIIYGNIYRNPVIQRSTPDPTIIHANDGVFYLYATEDIRNMPVYRSTDLVRWTFVGTAFTEETRPTFEPQGGLWAPDINYISGQYVLYYSMSVWGGEWTCGVGVATADKPEGPFTDRGMLFRSNTIGVQNSIDQNYVEDNGKKYLFWGSFHGIFGIELTADGLTVKPGSEKRQVAGTAYEGTYIHKRGKYYYLFASTGSCCEGLSSTYATVVGRSENLWGPYVDKQGRPMMDNNHEIVIHKNEAFVGTGHDSEIVQDKAGNDWIFYHGYSVANTTGRSLLMDKIIWIDDWPSVAGDSPSVEAEAPVF